MHLEGRPDTPGARRLTSSEACGKGAVSVRWHTPGVELARKADGASLFGFTAPLLTTSEGKKMGKTADGAVWLNAELLSPFEYWQFWRNTADADVGRFLKIFTELPREEIEALEALQGSEINKVPRPGPR